FHSSWATGRNSLELSMTADRHDETYAAVKAARSPEYNRRICVHEAGGHAFCAVALGSVVDFVTAIPHDGYAGRCVRRGAPAASLNLLDEQQAEAMTKQMLTTADLVAICGSIGVPPIGEARVDLAEGLVRTQVQIIELVGAGVAESVLYPDLPP